MKKKVKSLYGSISYSFYITYKSSAKCFLIRLFIQVITGVYPLLAALLYKKIINILSSSIVNEQYIQLIKPFLMTSILILLVKILLSTLDKMNGYYSELHREYVSKYISIEISNKAASLDLSYFDSTKLYDELMNIKRDSFAMQMLTSNIFNLIKSVVQLISACIVLFTFNWLFTLGLLALFIPSALVNKKYTKFSYEWLRKRVEWNRKMGYVLNTLTDKATAQDVRLYNYKDEMVDKYESIWSKWFKEKKKISLLKSIYTAISAYIPTIGVAAISVFVGIRVINRTLTLGDFSLYGAMAGQLSAGVFAVINVLANLYENNMKIIFFKQFMSWDNRVKNDGKIKVSKNPKIEIRNVCF
jgi:ABC-type bacteriocin/lantibiotic exporter with double-glycine peptidase domain